MCQSVSASDLLHEPKLQAFVCQTSDTACVHVGGVGHARDRADYLHARHQNREMWMSSTDIVVGPHRSLETEHDMYSTQKMKIEFHNFSLATTVRIKERTREELVAHLDVIVAHGNVK